MKREMKTYYTYLLKCADNTLYCGYTVDLDKRLAKHNAGKASKYTRGRLPVELVYWEAFASQHEAMAREYQLKQLTREEKLDLINNGKTGET